MNVRAYHPDLQPLWERLVASAPNATFLFSRRYLAYHQDRFPDRSAMLWHRDRLVGIFPACQQGEGVVSHAGLSYGGIAWEAVLRGGLMQEAWQQIADYYQQQGATFLRVRQMPSFYHQEPGLEEDAFLWHIGARLLWIENYSIVPPGSYSPNERKRRQVRKAHQKGVVVRELIPDELTEFWDMLRENLWRRYERLPVHTLTELGYLRAAFPEQIRMFGAFSPLGELLSSTCLFLTARAVHAQYIASNKEGQACFANDALFDWLLGQWPDRAFSFGVNAYGKPAPGLLEWKEGFGAVGWPQRCFELNFR